MLSQTSTDQQGKASTTLRTNHCRQFNFTKNPKAQVPAGHSESNTPVQARKHCAKRKPRLSVGKAKPRQLDDGKLADDNIAEAAPTESQTLGMSF